MAEPETLRLLLQKTIERNEDLVKINHESTIAIPTILSAIWGITSYIDATSKVNTLPFLAIISIFILLTWRGFAHYIDNDIAGNYSKIMRIEDHLEIPEDCSIYRGFIQGITKSFNKQLQENAIDLRNEQKIELISRLNEEKLLGSRGHDKWDYFALFLIDIAITVLFQGFVIFFIAVTLVSFIIYKLAIPKFGYIHIDPSESEFRDFLESVKKILPKNDNH